MRDRKTAVTICVVIFFALVLTVPLQYLTRKEVVVGLGSESAHSHAHGEGEDTHADEDSSGEENGHMHGNEEGHLATEVPLGVNLIPNYGFEVGTREQAWGWFKVGVTQGETVYRDDGVARSGLASAAVNTNGATIDGAGWLMRLDELPLDHVVIAEGYIKTEGFTGGAYLKITLETRKQGEDKPSVLDWAYTDVVAGESDWTFTSTRIYVPPEATGVWLEAGVSGQGRAWFDDLSLVVEEAE